MLEERLEYDQQDPGAAENILSAAIETGGKLRDKSLADALYRRGRVRRSLRYFSRALLDFRTALEGLNLFADAEYEPPPYLNVANIYLETARIHVQKKDIETAFATLRIAQDKARDEEDYPNWADIHLELARVYIAQHNYEEATGHLHESLRTVSASILDADLPAIYIEFAKISAYQRDFAHAVEALTKAYDATRPNDLMRARVLLVRGDLTSMQKNPVGALWYYFRAKIVFLATEVDVSNAVVSNALEVIERRVSKGREGKETLYATLQEALGDAILTRDSGAIVDTAVDLARLSMVFDAYDETLELVVSTRNKLAPAAFCYALQLSAEQLDVDPLRYEIDFENFVEALPEFDRASVESRV